MLVSCHYHTSHVSFFLLALRHVENVFSRNVLVGTINTFLQQFFDLMSWFSTHSFLCNETNFQPFVRTVIVNKILFYVFLSGTVLTWADELLKWQCNDLAYIGHPLRFVIMAKCKIIDLYGYLKKKLRTVCITPCSENPCLWNCQRQLSLSPLWAQLCAGNWSDPLKAHHSDILAIPFLTNWQQAATPSCAHNGDKAHFH